MYRWLFVVLATTAASCVCLPPTSRWSRVETSAMTAVIDAEGDAVMATYELRDETIEVISPLGPQLEKRILALVNRERHSAGVQALFFSPELAKAARQHSATMAHAGFF